MANNNWFDPRFGIRQAASQVADTARSAGQAALAPLQPLASSEWMKASPALGTAAINPVGTAIDAASWLASDPMANTHGSVSGSVAGDGSVKGVVGELAPLAPAARDDFGGIPPLEAAGGIYGLGASLKPGADPSPEGVGVPYLDPNSEPGRADRGIPQLEPLGDIKNRLGFHYGGANGPQSLSGIPPLAGGRQSSAAPPQENGTPAYVMRPLPPLGQPHDDRFPQLAPLSSLPGMGSGGRETFTPDSTWQGDSRAVFGGGLSVPSEESRRVYDGQESLADYARNNSTGRGGFVSASTPESDLASATMRGDLAEQQARARDPRNLEKVALESKAKYFGDALKLSEDRAVREQQQNELGRLDSLYRTYQSEVQQGKRTPDEAQSAFEHARQSIYGRVQALGGGKDFLGSVLKPTNDTYALEDIKR